MYPSTVITIGSTNNMDNNGYSNDTFEISEPEPLQISCNLTNGFKDDRKISLASIPAVQVSNLNKSYGTSSILKDFNMTVESGNIFALLGSSGCGKTTLISCILGLRKYDSGSISIFGADPGRTQSDIFGYMPQEVALFQDFTIGETLQYFGRVLGMKEAQINEKSEFLIKLLKLPPKDRFVKTLSGGQQRRTSFAVALLHSPKLLILDEPTVGVDSLLRQNIWDYLKELVRTNKTTIIITTHYLSEAHDAHMIGLIRDGRLLLEDTPKNAMRQYSCDTLDDVVLKVCLNDASGLDQNFPQITHHENKENKKFAVNKSLQQREPLNVRLAKSCDRLKALVAKNLISLWRQVFYVFFLLFLPGLQLWICCLAVGRESSALGLGVVNDELNGSNFAQDECPIEKLSCQFIKTLKTYDSIKLKHFQTEEDAVKATSRGDNWGYFTFGANFTDQFAQRQLDGAYADNSTIDESLIRTHLDMTSFQISSTLQKTLFQAFFKFSIQMLEDAGNNIRTAEFPISFDKPLYGSNNSRFTEYLAPGNMVSLITFMAVSLTGVVYITEKKSGVMERSIVSGVTHFEIILSHVISQYLIMIIQIVITFAIVLWVFDITIHGSIAYVILLVVLQGTMGMFFGLFLSSICDNESTVFQLSQSIIMPAFVLSGVMWPIESMPPLMRYIALCTPQTLAMESVRSLISRGWSILHPAVWPGFAISTGWIIFLAILTIFFSRRH